MKPIVGIFAEIDATRALSVAYDYAHAIEIAGGIPMVLPYIEDADTIRDVVSICDGFLFSGGEDICPSTYGCEKGEKCGEIQEHRDRLELSLFPEILRANKPILGICRGLQFINVALGGTLYQDIPSELDTDIEHSQSEDRYCFSHSANVVADTPLALLAKRERIRINSFHHQSIKALGRGLVAMAHSDDGVVEAIYSTDAPYIRGYQWHPERLIAKDDVSKAIFNDFICFLQWTK